MIKSTMKKFQILNIIKNYSICFQQIPSVSNKLLSQNVNKYATQSIREKLIQFVATKYGFYDVCHQHVGCTFHVSITLAWCPGRWLLQTLQRLTVTFTRRSTTAVFRPSALTGTAGHNADQCSVTPDGTYKHYKGILLQTKVSQPT